MLSQNQILNQGRYRIIHPYGNTESAGLYEAYDTVSNTKVVLRESSGGLGSEATPGQMETLKITFADQAKLLADIKHDTLLGVRDYFSETGRKYIVMEALDGHGLDDFIAGGKTPTVLEVAEWADHLLDALEYLHSRNPSVIHQNINPHNIRLGADNKVKLLVTGSEVIDSRPLDTSDSQEGSLNYQALEQLWVNLDFASQKVIANSLDDEAQEVLRQGVDARTDLYALAATLYHVLTGVEPVDPLARTIEMLEGSNDPLVQAHTVCPAVPTSMSDFLMKALEIKRELRYSSASAMRAALKGVTMALNMSKPAASQPSSASLPALASTPKAPVENSPAPVVPPTTAASASQPAAPPPVTPFDELKLELAGDDLLDLPETPVVPSIHTTNTPDVLSFESRNRVANEEPELGSMFGVQETKRGFFGSPVMLIAAAAVVAATLIGGWMFLGSGGKSPAPAAPAAPAAQPISEPVSSSPTAEQVMPPAANETQPAVIETEAVTATQEAPPAGDAAAERRAAAPAAKPKKQPAAEAKPAPEKKKVTVDDLINDN